MVGMLVSKLIRIGEQAFCHSERSEETVCDETRVLPTHNRKDDNLSMGGRHCEKGFFSRRSNLSSKDR